MNISKRLIRLIASLILGAISLASLAYIMQIPIPHLFKEELSELLASYVVVVILFYIFLAFVSYISKRE